jgi:hypothetical protein
VLVHLVADYGPGDLAAPEVRSSLAVHLPGSDVVYTPVRAFDTVAAGFCRVGAFADNAATESIFRLLQKNVLNRRRWQTRDELRLAIVIWIEKTYHRRRRQDTLGRHSAD